ncbi:hypothetical protein [Sphingobium aquiterrae]|uniref:hypothetical protein n=1 Tax=Sphingobium aquiterrae TaxID=2038656 RepID=UPI00301845D5
MSGDAPEKSQAQPTAPRPVDAMGRELDQWGLPLNGPARARALAALQKPDPNIVPEAWAEKASSGVKPGVVKAARAVVLGIETEKNDG